MSGKWEDDPKNWGRAFHSLKPDDIVVKHSSYWRSPHFTFECQYFFEIVANSERRAEMFQRNRFVRIQGREASRVLADNFGSSPSWFAPDDAGRYEVWVYQDDPRSHFKLLIDTESGNMFLSDYQI